MDLLKGIRKMEDLLLEGRRVLIRVDFGVPLAPDGSIADDARIQAAVPTIRHAIDQGAKVVLASHLGRPRGRRTPELSMLPVAERLQEMLTKEMGKEMEIFLPDESVGDGPRKVVMERVEGEVVLVENLRFHPEEEANDNLFAQKLSAIADVYVNDAFGACHRPHASVSAVAKYFSEKAAGLLVMKELSVLSKLLGSPDGPYFLVVGGERFSDKLTCMNNLLGRVRAILAGGAVAATMMAAKGLAVGRSRIEPDKVETAGNFLSRAKLRGVDVLLPIDVVVARDASDEAPTEVVAADRVPEDAMVLDIGPESAALFGSTLSGARTVFWNGPMGVYERRPFLAGTEAVAKAIARSSAMSVVGGTNTVAAVAKLVLTPFFKHVSMGGPATLLVLEGRELPGLEALREAT
jgi:phosphoglycerate kinase